VGKDKKPKLIKSPYLNNIKEIKKAADGGPWLEPGTRTFTDFNFRDIPTEDWERIFGKKEREKIDKEVEEKKETIEKDTSKET
jgi:hypothetical protein